MSAANAAPAAASFDPLSFLATVERNFNVSVMAAACCRTSEPRRSAVEVRRVVFSCSRWSMVLLRAWRS